MKHQILSILNHYRHVWVWTEEVGFELLRTWHDVVGHVLSLESLDVMWWNLSYCFAQTTLKSVLVFENFVHWVHVAFAHIAPNYAFRSEINFLNLFFRPHAVRLDVDSEGHLIELVVEVGWKYLECCHKVVIGHREVCQTLLLHFISMQ